VTSRGIVVGACPSSTHWWQSALLHSLVAECTPPLTGGRVHPPPLTGGRVHSSTHWWQSAPSSTHWWQSAPSSTHWWQSARTSPITISVSVSQGQH
jgi:hypothetical protein